MDLTIGSLLRLLVTAAWLATAAMLLARKRSRAIGLLAGAGGTLALAGAVAAEAGAGSGTHAVRALALGLTPSIAMHALLGMPGGALRTGARKTLAATGYAAGALVALLVWGARPSVPMWPFAIWCVLAAMIGGIALTARYRRSSGLERRRLQWIGWATTTAAGIATVAAALRLLVSWPEHLGEVAVGATILLPVALALSTSDKLADSVGRLLAHTVSVAGLSIVVVLVYLVIVLGLGRVPTEQERTLLLLSMIAAAVAALLYLPTRERLGRVANKLVYGERNAPDEVLRTFGSRLSRQIPLDELLLQMAESLRKTLRLSGAEVWMRQEGRLERGASDPDRGAGHLTVGPAEQQVVARAGVSGNAWLKVWLPELLRGREEQLVRVAPITHQGELLGLIVAERSDTTDQFREEDERVLTELARQVGLALHNVQLDSALQASLDELRRHAEELRASRQRIVTTADAARRKIERDLHDGAQQHLIALAVKVNLLKRMMDASPEQAKTMLEQLGEDLRETLQELRNLAHGIYPQVLALNGLAAALGSAAARATLPTEVLAADIGRYPQEVEAAIYFCCLEASQNAGKHAGEGATATIRVWEEEGALLFEYADTGAGFDMRVRGLGSGFTNMQDRLGAIGGTLSVDSAPGRGTRITGRVPVARRSVEQPA